MQTWALTADQLPAGFGWLQYWKTRDTTCCQGASSVSMGPPAQLGINSQKLQASSTVRPTPRLVCANWLSSGCGANSNIFFFSFLVFTALGLVPFNQQLVPASMVYLGGSDLQYLAAICFDMPMNQIRQISVKMGPRVKRLRQKFYFVRLC